MSAILTTEQLANAPAHDVIASHETLQELVETLRHRLGAEQRAHDLLKTKYETLATKGRTEFQGRQTEEAVAMAALVGMQELLGPLHLPIFVHIGLPKTNGSLIASCGMDQLNNRKAVHEIVQDMVQKNGGLL